MGLSRVRRAGVPISLVVRGIEPEAPTGQLVQLGGAERGYPLTPSVDSRSGQVQRARDLGVRAEVRYDVLG